MDPVPVIDLNADVGESFGRWELGDDDALLAVVTSANVACGFHAGDPGTLRRTCLLAARNQVAVGAQVSYRDLAGFGRRFIDMDPADLRDDVLYQIGALEVFARTAGTGVTYVKPHGALYHAVVGHERQAEAVVRAVLDHGAGLALLGPPGSALLRRAADAGLPTVAEAFADRAYAPDGSLVPRGHPGAVLHDPAEVARQAVGLALGEGVRSIDGGRVDVAADSLCLHGDTPGVAGTARAVRAALEAAGVELRSFGAADREADGAEADRG